jgi:hypothetical protein
MRQHPRCKHRQPEVGWIAAHLPKHSGLADAPGTLGKTDRPTRYGTGNPRKDRQTHQVRHREPQRAVAPLLDGRQADEVSQAVDFAEDHDGHERSALFHRQPHEACRRTSKGITEAGPMGKHLKLIGYAGSYLAAIHGILMRAEEKLYYRNQLMAELPSLK